MNTHDTTSKTVGASNCATAQNTESARPSNASRQATLSFKPGQPVICNGHRGAIIRRYEGNMWEVRLQRGEVCVDASDISPII